MFLNCRDMMDWQRLPHSDRSLEAKDEAAEFLRRRDGGWSSTSGRRPGRSNTIRLRSTSHAASDNGRMDGRLWPTEVSNFAQTPLRQRA
jgi:hypothetical protein